MFDAAPERTCPACGHAARTLFDRCPACGAPYGSPGAGGGGRRPRWLLPAAGAALVVVVAVVVALLGQAGDERERRRTGLAASVAAERARLARVQRPHRGAAVDLRPPAGASPARRLAARAALVGAVEDAITADARLRARAGELDGPIVTTECGPLERREGAVPDDRVLAKPVGRYDCVAVRRDVRQDGRRVARLGHPFVAALDFRRFTFVWCRNTPAQSERGEALAEVRLARVCLATKGRVVGSGYADVPVG
ncbi:hypothetical protein [Conexibacter sp. SYSU D00693]|uniref:hypothetical protein n=1 Tax=Conexibacter sp. SYSU D00693 TaxID=2812560 RepID=UPI00196AC240|nr:hypothetical protein [Conexibacter sp. SYSU D00693]